MAAKHVSPMALYDRPMKAVLGSAALMPPAATPGTTPLLEQKRQPASQWPAQEVGQSAVRA